MFQVFVLLHTIAKLLVQKEENFILKLWMIQKIMLDMRVRGLKAEDFQIKPILD